jgi:alkylhydroperoxidase family enzyme
MAMSLVPDAVRAMGRLSEAHYLRPALVALPDAEQPGRAIDRPQVELIAARVSALNECFY